MPDDKPKNLFKYSKKVGNITVAVYVGVDGPLKKLTELPSEHIAVQHVVGFAHQLHDDLMPELTKILFPPKEQKQAAA